MANSLNSVSQSTTGNIDGITNGISAEMMQAIKRVLSGERNVTTFSFYGDTVKNTFYFALLVGCS